MGTFFSRTLADLPAKDVPRIDDLLYAHEKQHKTQILAIYGKDDVYFVQ